MDSLPLVTGPKDKTSVEYLKQQEKDYKFYGEKSHPELVYEILEEYPFLRHYENPTEDEMKRAKRLYKKLHPIREVDVFNLTPEQKGDKNYYNKNYLIYKLQMLSKFSDTAKSKLYPPSEDDYF